MSFEQYELMNFVHSLSVGLARSTTGSGAVVQFVNHPLAVMLGSHEDELVGVALSDIFADQKSFRTYIGQLKGRKAFYQNEVVLRKKQGGTFWALVSVTIDTDQRGRPKFYNFVIEDIAGLKEVDKDLSGSRELFRVIFENSPAAIMVSDRDERIIAWNPCAAEMLHMDKRDLFNKPVRELYSAREWRRIRGFRIRQKGILSGITTQVLCKDGAAVDVDIAIAILKDRQGNNAGAVAIMRDISKQKHIQEMLVRAKAAAEEASRTKSMFLAKMSHELRTPMNAIIGMLDLTLDTPLNEEQKDNMCVAKDAAGNLLRLINDILDLSRAESGKISIEKIEISVPEIIRSVCKGLTVLAQNKNISLGWSVSADVPSLVMGDPVRIRQIIINLVNNSIKFTHKGGVIISAALHSRTDKECEILFSVKDTGIGIPRSKQGRIFEVFSQADEKTSRCYGGTGLGLAISKKLSELMGGRLWVDSEEGSGSTFHFILKLEISPNTGISAAAAAAVAAAAQASGVVPEDDLGRLRILLAEDNLVNQKIAVRVLEKRGWEVVAANNGREALEALGKSRFDLILMDDHMPEMTGVEATAIIRTEEKQTGMHLPIIAMTANAMSGDREKYLSLGMDAYVSKPIDRESLFREIINTVRMLKGKTL